MCGLTGSWNPHSMEQDPWAWTALGMIRFRGPDAASAQSWGHATHAHCRLAILDLHERSDQPFVSHNVVLSYVGELWNYRELRESLKAVGYEFHTEGDTEVVSAALSRWGPRALHEFDGQFAMAWTDKLTGKTYLARDPLGEVPLYRLETESSLFQPGGVRWASERRCFGRDGADATPVPPGSVWQVGDGGIPHFYYDVEAVARRRGVTRNPAKVRGLIRQAVLKRLQADVPVAFLCSGGLDSTLILSHVRDEVGGNVVAYTAAMPGHPSADLKAARRACEFLGVELREVSVPRPGEHTPYACVEAIEIPMKAQVEIAWPCLMLADQIREDGFKVVLSGEGADELFGGYGNLARKATSDTEWRRARVAAMQKMGRGNCVRTNKAFMHFGVEPRLPFLDRELVAEVLPLGVKGCPPHKGLLKEAARGMVPDWVIDRPKVTFQGGVGTDAAMDEVLNGDVVKTYNRISRELFGGLPRG